MRKVIVMLFLLLLPMISKAQSTVSELSWNDATGATQSGLLVLYPNNKGFLKLKSFIPQVGWVWVLEDAVFSFQTDFYGNTTYYINCFNPRTSPYVPWSADNFVIYPNGSMFTMDAAGMWSTQIRMNAIANYNWQRKFNEYGVQP